MRATVLFLTLLAPAAMLRACSCSGDSTPCSAIPGNGIVFVGLVLEDSGEGWGKGPARVRVLEVLQGLHRNVREVDVHSMARTSCYMRLKEGETYVIFAGSKPGSLLTGGCSHTFNVRGSEHILDVLRNAATGGPFRIIGKVYRKADDYSGYGSAVPNAAVAAEFDGGRRETVSDRNGHYELLNVMPGTYRFSASHDGYVFDSEKQGSLSTKSTGCEIHNIGLWPDGRLSGTVRSVAGKPIEGVRVQAFGRESYDRSRFASSPLRVGSTNADGIYTLDRLPPGEYIVGVNAETYYDREAYPPTLYPGVPDRKNAEPIRIEHAERRSGIDIQIPPAREALKVRVQVVMEDGAPVPKAGLKVLDGQGVQRAFLRESTGLDGWATVTLFRGERYAIESFYYKSRVVPAGGQAVRIQSEDFEGRSEPVLLDTEISVRIILRRKVRPEG